jgi:hypothetical protein
MATRGWPCGSHSGLTRWLDAAAGAGWRSRVGGTLYHHTPTPLHNRTTTPLHCVVVVCWCIVALMEVPSWHGLQQCSNRRPICRYFAERQTPLGEPSLLRETNTSSCAGR